MMKRFSLFILLLVGASSASASTFVGNGGNSKDVELQVTLLQIEKSLKQIQQDGSQNSTLCECDPSLEGHQLCEVLKKLTLDQKKQCKDELSQASSAMLNLLQNPKGVQIIWTLETMQVSEKGGLRQAEGVAVLKEKKIFLNRDEFLNLKDYERIYLLTHELGHLISFQDRGASSPRYIQDDEKYEAFQQDDGGRQFLNALGASVAMKSFAIGAISDYTASLNRSKNSKPHWLTLTFINTTRQKDEATFSIERYSGSHFRYRYQLNENWGAGIGFRRFTGEQTFYETARTKGEIKMTEASAAYRWLPFSDPFSIWGPSHFVFSAGMFSGQASLEIDDGIVSVTDNAKFMGPVVMAEYYLPLIHGVWVQFGVSYANYSYEFKEVGYQSEKNHTDYGIGVSYAF